MRIEQLTFTRFIVSILVVAFHFGTDVIPFNIGYVSFLFRNGDIGVSYFFVLSGFIMVIAYGNRPQINAADYFRKRLARIFPVYLVALCLMVLLSFCKGNGVDLMDFGLSLAAVQAWFPTRAMALNTPGWSLSVEVFFYALFPLLYNKVYAVKALRVSAGLVLIVWLGSQALLYLLSSSGLGKESPLISHNLLFHFPLSHLSQFLAGNIAGLVFSRIALKARNYDFALIGLCLVFLFIMKLLPNPTPLNFHNGLLALVFIPLLVLISLNTGSVSSVFNRKPFVFLGEMSYSIYILQLPVFLWTHYLLDPFGIGRGVAFFYTFLSMLLLLSALAYLFIENPVRKKFQGMGKKVQQRAMVGVASV